MKLKTISRETHGSLRWKRPKEFFFAATDMYCQISISELRNLFFHYPAAFIRREETFSLAVILGCEENKNLFVGMNGTWVGPTIPINYCNFPFRLIPIEPKQECGESEQMALSINHTNESTDDVDGEPYFTDTGELSELVSTISNQLVEHNRNLKITDSLCDKLRDLELIVPWEHTLNIEGVTTELKGIYCIDEVQLKKLSGKKLKDLMTMGAMPLIYMQTLSKRNLQQFPRLVIAHKKAAGINVHGDEQLMFGDIRENETINFDSI